MKYDMPQESKLRVSGEVITEHLLWYKLSITMSYPRQRKTGLLNLLPPDMDLEHLTKK
jgi:hypothetical protein